MKKALTLIAGVAFVAVLFTSCMKDYTCSCTVSTLPITIAIPKESKKNATATCDLARTTYQIGDPNATCTLK
ncbi:MAG: hypothetical protein D4R43_03840 [Sphingobacteriales bacterium]|nr:MAG: hypothetical protein D4R43_03840 [Sphingobacteriales bacterium]